MNGSFDAVRHAELRDNAEDMILGRAGTEVQLRGDPVVVQTTRQALQNVQFAWLKIPYKGSEQGSASTWSRVIRPRDAGLRVKTTGWAVVLSTGRVDVGACRRSIER